MKKSNHSTRIFMGMSLVIICCGVMIYFDSKLSTCHGLFHAFRDVILMFVLILVSSGFILWQLYQVFKKQENIKLRIFASLITLVCLTISFRGKYKWRELRLEKSIYNFSIKPGEHSIGKISLLNSNTYYGFYGHIDWSCSFTNTYKKSNDTLILLGNPYQITGGILTNKYLFSDTLLIPINPKGDNSEENMSASLESVNN